MLYNGESLSLWIDTVEMPKFAPLEDNLETEVCIVGGGIAGLTTAYLLMKEGKKVCLLESFELASGQTGRTTAHFVNALDDRFFDLEKYFGEDGAKKAAESHTAAINLVERIVKKENIDCNLERLDGYLFAKDDPRPDVLINELDAARRAGLEVQILERAPIAGFNTGPALRFQNQMQLHPLKYLSGLVTALIDGGVRIFTHSHVTEVKGGKDAYVKTALHKINCDAVVVATNAPINDMFAIHTKQAAYRTYVLGFDITPGSIPKALFWDTLDPYHYFRLAKDREGKDIILVGGEDRKTGQDDYPEDRYKNLEYWAREHLPMVRDLRYQWSGQVLEPVDSLGFLGHNPADRDNVYVITGDSGNGMTHTTIGAMIITDQIMKRKNSWEKLYDPSRKSLRATKEFLKENINAATQYKDWFRPESKAELNTLKPDHGIIIRDHGKLIAAYKAKDGTVSYCSAVCTHLGGVVSWNEAEKSWDCPVHGSRFDCHGNAIEGPAFKALEKIDRDKIENEPVKEEESRL